MFEARFDVVAAHARHRAVPVDRAHKEPLGRFRIRTQDEIGRTRPPDDAVRELEALLLCNLGYRVLGARSADEALSTARAVRGIDLILIDFHLPRMNGKELIEKIKAHDRAVKVILASGAEIQSSAQGIPFLEKPFEIAELAETVRSVLGNSEVGSVGKAVSSQRYQPGAVASFDR